MESKITGTSTTGKIAKICSLSRKQERSYTFPFKEKLVFQFLSDIFQHCPGLPQHCAQKIPCWCSHRCLWYLQLIAITFWRNLLIFINKTKFTLLTNGELSKHI